MFICYLKIIGRFTKIKSMYSYLLDWWDNCNRGGKKIKVFRSPPLKHALAPIETDAIICFTITYGSMS